MIWAGGVRGWFRFWKIENVVGGMMRRGEGRRRVLVVGVRLPGELREYRVLKLRLLSMDGEGVRGVGCCCFGTIWSSLSEHVEDADEG